MLASDRRASYRHGFDVQASRGATAAVSLQRLATVSQQLTRGLVPSLPPVGLRSVRNNT
jgi:hypothetical protein